MIAAIFTYLIILIQFKQMEESGEKNQATPPTPFISTTSQLGLISTVLVHDSIDPQQ